MKQSDQNFIVINGKTYDARSGMMIQQNDPLTPPKKVFRDVSSAKRTSYTPPNTSVVQRQQDGTITSVVKKTKVVQQVRPQHVQAAKVHRSPQKTQTLLRNGLTRPRVQSDITPVPKAVPRIPNHNQQAAERAARARAFNRQNDVQHFSSPVTSQPEPQEPKEEPIKTSIALHQLQGAHLPKQQKPTKQLQGSELKEHLIQERLDSMPHSREEKFQAQQKKVNRFFAKQPRLLTAVAGTMGVLLLIAYVTYLNMPGISMRMAANKAGFAATMPDYKPSGYAFSGTSNTAPGQISLKFASNTNDDTFVLTQKQSQWDSHALLENYVAKKTDNYLTYQEKGLTIYMYDGKASWVNGGLWYAIDGSAKLSSDQILKLATSM